LTVPCCVRNGHRRHGSSGSSRPRRGYGRTSRLFDRVRLQEPSPTCNWIELLNYGWQES
jgi:hypothetical protein